MLPLLKSFDFQIGSLSLQNKFERRELFKLTFSKLVLKTKILTYKQYLNTLWYIDVTENTLFFNQLVSIQCV